jgi:hypothetical protein
MADDGGIHIRVQDTVYDLNMQDLTWGELAELEDLLGGSIEDSNLESAKGVLAVAYLAVRRKDQLITIDALKTLPIGEIELVDDPNPTLAAESGPDEPIGSQS